MPHRTSSPVSTFLPNLVIARRMASVSSLALVQQWDGKKWNVVSDWIEPMRDVVRPKLEAAALEEVKKLGYTAMRDCAKEK